MIHTDTTPADVRVSQSPGSTIVSLTAITSTALNWIGDNVSFESWQLVDGRNLLVDHRYAHDILLAMINDELTVAQ